MRFATGDRQTSSGHHDVTVNGICTDSNVATIFKFEFHFLGLKWVVLVPLFKELNGPARRSPTQGRKRWRTDLAALGTLLHTKVEKSRKSPKIETLDCRCDCRSSFPKETKTPWRIPIPILWHHNRMLDHCRIFIRENHLVF